MGRKRLVNKFTLLQSASGPFPRIQLRGKGPEFARTRESTRAAFRRHRHNEFIVLLKSLARRYPGRETHLICDNYETTNTRR